MKLTKVILALTIAASTTGPVAWAQATPSETPRPPMHVPACANPTTDSVHTFYLHNVSQQSEANEIFTAVRNMLPPDAKSFLTNSENAIILCGGPDQVALTQKLLNDLDRPKKNYHITYTVTDIDGGKRIGTQHFSMVLAPGQLTTLKQGTRVPIATGSYNVDTTTQQNQYSYLDIGMNVSATLNPLENGVSLQTSVERSSIADEKSASVPQNPILRQVILKSVSLVANGKPMLVGSIDFPGSSRHLDIEVEVEQLPNL